MYDLILAPQAKKQLSKIKKKLDKSLVRNAIQDLQEVPQIGKPLRDDFLGNHSYRIKDFRIVYRIDEKEKRVYVYSIQHRSDAYN